MWKKLLTLGVLLVIGANAFVRAPSRGLRKQLAGPASEFSSLAIPSPVSAAVRADSGFIHVKLAAVETGGYRWSGELDVDSDSEFALSVLSKFTPQFVITLQPPDWDTPTVLTPALFNGPDAIGKMTSGPYGIDGASVPAVTYTFPNPPMGAWKIVIESASAVNQPAGVADAVLILNNESPYQLLSHLNSYELQLDQPLGISVQMYDKTQYPDELELSETSRPAALANCVTSAVLHVTYPGGATAEIVMKDDGLEGDVEANDGIYGAQLTATQHGNYKTRVVVRGTGTSGRPFYRTSEHLVPVALPVCTLTGLASATLDTQSGVVSFYVDIDEPEAMTRLRQKSLEPLLVDVTTRVYAEVWGSAVENQGQYDEYVPVAWVQAMVDSETRDGRSVLRLDLNERWLQRAGAVAPLQLRNVVVQDRTANVILSRRDAIYVKEEAAEELSATALRSRLDYTQRGEAVEITEAMKVGPRPAQWQTPKKAEGAATGKLILVHGYCSGPVWPLEDFTDAVLFEDYNQSRSQDEFALKIMEFANAQGLQSCGLVAHSQGGMASLHLKAYYWSCLDTAEGERLMQSVGTPYGGCSLAGTIADIGSVFGIGCGEQTDLTVDGASLWLAKVPAEARAAQNFYTTQYKEDWWILSDCVTASNLVLYRPNDGTCEKKFADLQGANAMGHKVGECHTDDMKYPPQCRDSARNAEMSAHAAR